MIPVVLQSGATIKQQGEEINLQRSTSYISSKTNVKSGRWYYEFKHLSGNQYHIIGFKTNSGGIYYYSWGNINIPRIYLVGSFMNSSNYAYIPFSISPIHTVGVGIDLEGHQFYVYYEHNYFSYPFPKQQSFEGFNSRVWGAHIDDTDELITVNFGSFSFHHNISGFLPWSSDSALSSNHCQINYNFLLQFIYVLIIAFFPPHYY